jgi:hypothetical protein
MNAGRGERGVALVITIMALLLMSALGAALVLTSTSETIIAAHFRDQIAGRYAADSVISRAIDDLAGLGDWSLVMDGSVRSAWVDGPPSGLRTLSDGSTLDLAQAVNLANCQKSSPCSPAELAAVTADRPWGANNPRWTPYAYGPLRDLRASSGTIDSPYYVLLMAGNGPVAPLLALRAEAFGPRGAHAVVELTAGYNDDPGQGAVNILSWREVR